MVAADRLMFVGLSDLAGIVRGKSFPLAEWDERLRSGIGWTPTNVQITCFDTIAETPFGALGDLSLVPDPSTRMAIDDDDDVFDFALGDVRELTGEPWAFCTRSLARRAIAALYDTCGATPIAAFEHEFQIKNADTRVGDSYGLKGFRDAKDWLAPFWSALDQAGCQPETFMKEYGPSQYEITVKPATGIGAPDRAVALRLITHDVLTRHGAQPSFSPILDPDIVGNGVHLHLSFVNDGGAPLTYDQKNPFGMSELARHFCGGVLKYLDQILALLAASEVSYLRLTPHRWSAAFNNLGYRDREASVRICPVNPSNPEEVARQFNIEVRAIDAAASPYLVFAAIVFAGTQGLKDRIEPTGPTEEDLSLLSEDQLEARGFQRLPESLDLALRRFGESKAVRDWFGDEFVDVYVAHKHGEMSAIEGLDWKAKCDRYKDAY